MDFFFQRSSFHWGSHPKLGFLQFGMRGKLTNLWNSEGFELLPVLKKKVPKKGAIETLKHVKHFPCYYFLISHCSTFPDTMSSDFSLAEFFLLCCCDTDLSCKNLMCCSTGRWIFGSCVLFFPAIQEHIRIHLYSGSTHAFSWTAYLSKPEFLKPTTLLKDSQSCPLTASYIDASMLGLSFHLLMLFRCTWAFFCYCGGGDNIQNNHKPFILRLDTWHVPCCFCSSGYLVSH